MRAQPHPAGGSFLFFFPTSSLSPSHLHGLLVGDACADVDGDLANLLRELLRQVLDRRAALQTEHDQWRIVSTHTHTGGRPASSSSTGLVEAAASGGGG